MVTPTTPPPRINWPLAIGGALLTALIADKLGPWVWLVAGFIALQSWDNATKACQHGVKGAVANRDRCVACIQAIEDSRRQAAESLQRTRERQFTEWRSRVRMPEYLVGMDPREFERLTCTLFRQMGYEVLQTKYTGDGGIDAYLRRGSALTLLQCKRVKGSVGEPVLRDLFGTMHAKNAQAGLVVTTGSVSKKARAWSAGKPIRIIELNELVGLIRSNFDEAAVVPAHFQPIGRPPTLG